MGGGKYSTGKWLWRAAVRLMSSCWMMWYSRDGRGSKSDIVISLIAIASSGSCVYAAISDMIAFTRSYGL